MLAKNPVIRPILAPIHPPNDPKSVAPSIERILLFKMHTSYVPNLAGGLGGAVPNRTNRLFGRVWRAFGALRDGRNFPGRRLIQRAFLRKAGDDVLELCLRIVPLPRAE